MFGPAGLRGAGTLDAQVDPRAEEDGRKIFRPYAGGSGSRERVTTPGGRRSSTDPRPRASPARSPDPVRYPLERQGCELFEAPGRHSCASGNPEHGRLLARTCVDVTRMPPASGPSGINIPSEDMPNPQQERQSGRPRCRTCAGWLFVRATGLFTACDLLAPPLHGHREIAAALRPLSDLGYAEPDYTLLSRGVPLVSGRRAGTDGRHAPRDAPFRRAHSGRPAGRRRGAGLAGAAGRNRAVRRPGDASPTRPLDGTLSVSAMLRAVTLRSAVFSRAWTRRSRPLRFVAGLRPACGRDARVPRHEKTGRSPFGGAKNLSPLRPASTICAAVGEIGPQA